MLSHAENFFLLSIQLNPKNQLFQTARVRPHAEETDLLVILLAATGERANKLSFEWSSTALFLSLFFDLCFTHSFIFGNERAHFGNGSF
uniref:Uncharacterized protein n=1 Tax=Caenorhabditis japonica TaxID=281687 RepID=A0A8R1IMM6_CAEJA